MGAVLFLAAMPLQTALATPTLRYLALLALVLLGALTYFGVGQLIGAFKFAELRRGGRSA